MTAEPADRQRRRIDAIDVVRGVIMILMALDHTRDFFGNPAISPTDLSQTTVALFFTRWTTHFCAPVFFLLTGVGARVSLAKRTPRGLSWYLFSRGVWLIFLETVVFRCLGLQFNFDYRLTLLDVLWALGWAMIVLAGLVRLPSWAVTSFGVALVALHNLLDPIQFSDPLGTVLHALGFLVTGPHAVFVAYPLIPWVGVTAIGYGLGQIYAWEPARARAFLGRLGGSLVAAFVILRWLNVYGDPGKWAVQKSAVFTVISFLNTLKYPPSLLFLLMTLGPAMLFLRAVHSSTPRWLAPAVVFGRVPLFYYLVHMPLIHILAIGLCALRYGQVHWMFESPALPNFPFTPPPGWGVSLPFIYLVWAIVVAALYPLCRWFADVKRRRPDGWLSYL